MIFARQNQTETHECNDFNYFRLSFNCFWYFFLLITVVSNASYFDHRIF